MKKILQKLLVFGLLVGSLLPCLAPFQYASATDGSTIMGDFLGLVSWRDGVDDVSTINSEEMLKKNIWTIVSNITTDAAMIASYLVVGYVIWGGYQYIFSNGDAAKVANGKKTLTHAFIGLAITMSASVILGAIRAALIGGGSLSCDALNGGNGCYDTATMVTSLINWVTGVVGVVSAIFVVSGGISYMTSAGDPGKLAKAKTIITNALIGLAIVALASVITSFVSSTIRDNTSYLENATPAIGLIEK